MITVTAHAIDRYIERVAPVDRETAYAAMAAAERGIEAAALFGATTVRLANGAKLILEGTTIVTVLSRNRIANGDVMLAELPRLRAWHAHRGCRYRRDDDYRPEAMQ